MEEWSAVVLSFNGVLDFKRRSRLNISEDLITKKLWWPNFIFNYIPSRFKDSIKRV